MGDQFRRRFRKLKLRTDARERAAIDVSRQPASVRANGL